MKQQKLDNGVILFFDELDEKIKRYSKAVDSTLKVLEEGRKAFWETTYGK